MGRHPKSNTNRKQQEDSLRQSDDTPANSDNLSQSQDHHNHNNNVSLAGKKRARGSNNSGVPRMTDNATSKYNKSDDECDDDELIDKLEEQSKRKKETVDLDKMTRRQRMAYLA